MPELMPGFIVQAMDAADGVLWVVADRFLLRNNVSDYVFLI